MGELELIGLHEDGEHLVLAAADGQRFRLRIDEPLRAAVRRDRPQLEQLRVEQTGAPSPREIQSRVRAGQTAEEIADESGIAVEQVRRYEGPVLAEREFIAEQARGTRVGRDPGAPLLGELVVDRLAARGVDTEALEWDAFREAGGPWTVLARFPVDDAPREARWSYDAGARLVHAEEDEARWLSETELDEGPIPRRHLSAVRDVVYDVAADGAIRPVLASVDTPSGPEPEPADLPDPTDALLDDLRTRRGVRQPLDLDDDADDFEGFGPQHAFDFGHLDDAPGAHPADADAADQARVYPAPAAVPSATPASGQPAHHEKDDRPTAPASGPEPTDEPDAEPDSAAARPRNRRGRAKVPSWDEIVFGAKPE